MEVQDTHKMYSDSTAKEQQRYSSSTVTCRKGTVPVHVQSIVQSMKRRAGPIGVHEIPSSGADVTQGK